MNVERTGKHYFSYVHDDIKLITNESFGLRVVLDQARVEVCYHWHRENGRRRLRQEYCVIQPATTDILSRQTIVYQKYFQRAWLLWIRLWSIFVFLRPPPPQLAYNVCPFGRGGGGLYPTNGEARSHFYIPGISRGREETDDSEKMYINYGSFRKISWDIWKKLLNTWKGKCFLMYKRCFCFILKIRFWHDEHLQHAKNISKKTTCLSNKRRIFLF